MNYTPKEFLTKKCTKHLIAVLVLYYLFRKKNSGEILKFLSQDFESGVIGRVNRRNGKIKIESMFSDKKIVL